MQEWVEGTTKAKGGLLDVESWFLEAYEKMSEHKGVRRTKSLDDFSFDDHLFKIGYRRLVDWTVDHERRARSAPPHRR